MKTTYRRYFILVAVSFISLYITGCDSLSKPHLSINENAPYTLTISDFDWGYGLVEINKFNGDFETLDRKVFNLLHNKEGSCSVVMNIAHVTKYGQSKVDTSTIGMIDLSELNRYQSWEYWHKMEEYKSYYTDTCFRLQRWQFPHLQVIQLSTRIQQSHF